MIVAASTRMYLLLTSNPPKWDDIALDRDRPQLVLAWSIDEGKHSTPNPITIEGEWDSDSEDYEIHYAENRNNLREMVARIIRKAETK